jgi:hypothetical protein
MYKATSSPRVFIRLLDGAFVPRGADTGDSQELEKWLAKNTPEPADPVVAPEPQMDVAAEVKALKAALINKGTLSDQEIEAEKEALAGERVLSGIASPIVVREDKVE